MAFGWTKAGIGAGIVLGCLVAGFGLGDRYKQGKWDAAKAKQTAHEIQLIQQADQLESKLNAASSSRDAIADELEKAYEDRVTAHPVPLACTDSHDDVDGLRRLLRGGK